MTNRTNVLLGIVVGFVNLTASLIALRLAGVILSVEVGGGLLVAAGLGYGGFYAVRSVKELRAFRVAAWKLPAYDKLRDESQMLRVENQELKARSASWDRERQSLSREVTRLGADLKRAVSERSKYEQTFRNVIERSPRALSEEREITLMIGDSDVSDHTREDWVTRPINGTQPVIWHLMAAGVEGAAPRRQSFRQLRDVQAFEVQKGKTRRLEPLAIGMKGGKVWAAAAFDAAIEAGDARKWWFEYSWADQWRPLRATNNDRYSLNLTEEEAGLGVKWPVVVVKFVFAKTALDPEARLVGPPVFESDETTDELGRRVITFTAKDAPCRVYYWDVRVQGFQQSLVTAERLEGDRREG